MWLHRFSPVQARILMLSNGVFFSEGFTSFQGSDTTPHPPLLSKAVDMPLSITPQGVYRWTRGTNLLTTEANLLSSPVISCEELGVREIRHTTHTQKHTLPPAHTQKRFQKCMRTHKQTDLLDSEHSDVILADSRRVQPSLAQRSDGEHTNTHAHTHTHTQLFLYREGGNQGQHLIPYIHIDKHKLIQKRLFGITHTQQ